MKSIRFIALLVLLSFPVTLFAQEKCMDKDIVGPIVKVGVIELGLKFKSRVDTGAKTSSINAYDIKVEGGKSHGKNMKNDLGKSISFTTQNNLGQEQSYTGEIIKVSKIKNAQGVERRYAIRLKIKLGKKIKSIQINLRNRKHLEYKLLLGRNWLENDYLVDVTK